MYGNGYPFKLKGKQIHLFGRITSIANFYDNLTTERPYKKAYTPYETLELMSENKGDFDQNLLVEFIKMIGLHTLNWHLCTVVTVMHIKFHNWNSIRHERSLSQIYPAISHKYKYL